MPLEKDEKDEAYKKDQEGPNSSTNGGIKGKLLVLPRSLIGSVCRCVLPSCLINTGARNLGNTGFSQLSRRNLHLELLLQVLHLDLRFKIYS